MFGYGPTFRAEYSDVFPRLMDGLGNSHEWDFHGSFHHCGNHFTVWLWSSYIWSHGDLGVLSYYRKLWIRCGNEKGGVPFRVGNANPGGSRVEGDATDVEGSREWSWKGSRRAAF